MFKVCAVPPRRSAVLTVFHGATAINDGTTAEPRRSWRCHCRLCRTSTVVAPHLRCDEASSPVIVETWPDPAVTRIPTFADWTFHFKFNQNVNRAARPAFVKVYYRVGAWVFSIDASAGDNVHFPAPDTMQVVVPANLKALLAGGQVFHVLLDEGVVTGPGPCYVPSAAVTDPNFYKVLYSGLPDRYYDTPYNTTSAPPSSCSDTDRPTVIQSWPADGFYSSLSIAKLTLKYDREVTVAQSLTGVYIYRRHAWQSAQNCKIVQTAVDTIETDCYSSMNLDQFDLDGHGVFTIIMAEDVVTGPAPCYAPSGWLAITLYTGSPPATDGAPTYAYTTKQFGDWTTPWQSGDNPGFQQTTEYWPTTQEDTESPFTEPATTPWMDCASMAYPAVVEAWADPTVGPYYSWIWNFRFDQHIIKATGSSWVYANFYESSGQFRLGIPTWHTYHVRFPAPDTLQVLVHGPSYLPIGQEYYVLLDEGAVNGAAPCYLPSAAVNDTYLCRDVYGVAPNATDEVPIYTTHVLEDSTTSSESDNPTKQPTEFTTEEIGWSTHQPRVTQPPLLPSMDCSDSGMTVFIPRSVIGDALSSHLHFLDPACVGSHHNTTHVKIATTYDRCGTFMEVHGDSVIFFNVIHDEAVPVEPGSVITRDRDIEIPVQCIMDLEGFAEISFRPDTSKITFREDGFGSFNFSLRLYHGNDYTTPYQPADYPVHVAMGNKLYFEARTWSEPGLELFVQTCRATPSSNSDDFHRYTFIQDGCVEDNTVVFHPSDDPDIERFEIDAFAFVDALPQPVVYVHCDMVLCNSTDAYSRCAIGCPTRSMNLLPGVHRRHARSASGSRAYAITQGPISVMENGGKEGSEMSSVQLPILLTTVCLLVGCVLVLGTLIVVMRKRTQRLQLYSSLATEEN